MTVDGYRRLLGVLLLWVLLPLPFLYIIMPPFWIVAAVVGLYLCLRPSSRPQLSGTVLNLIGVGIIIAVALAGGLRVGPLRPLGHLLLLLTSVRVLVVSDRRSFLRALLLVFLVGVVSLTSSTHVVVAVYFVVSAAIWWWVGIRVHLVGITGPHRMVSGALPRPLHVIVATAMALLVAIPIFIALPRMRSPWIAGRGGTSSVTGFSSHVDLGGVGAIRESHEIAMMVRSVSGEVIRPEWMRLRATALERMTINSWAPRGAILTPKTEGGLVLLQDGGADLSDAVALEIELLHPRRYFFLPEGSVALSASVELRADPTGGVAFAYRVSEPVTYTVWVARNDPQRAADPPRDGPPRFDLAPEVSLLAAGIVAGIKNDRARAESIEAYLQENYSYSMSGMTHLRADPVSWFLLHERQGHCEYFAGAMVALLVDLDIPARMVAGYSGGSLSLDGEEAVIRETNAHAWVEAWVGDDGAWTTFDPTPVSDIPTLSRPSGRDRIRWAVDWVQTSWDRYVLTFSFGEQMGLLSAATDGVHAVMRRVSWRIVPIGLAGLLIPPALWWLIRRLAAKRPGRRRAHTAPAADAVARLARRLERAGIVVPARATVRWISHRARAQWPAAGPALAELAWRAERELYAGPELEEVDLAAVRTLWTQARQGMRRQHISISN
jgi:hypothetical protein